MPRMIDLIRQSAVPSAVMRQAARGALAVPAAEMLEILVFLADHPLFGEQAQLALAGWPEESLRAIAADPQTPPEVLVYLSNPTHMRAATVPALAENPSLSTAELESLCAGASTSAITGLLAAERVRSSPALLLAIRSNPRVDFTQAAAVDALLSAARQSVEVGTDDDPQVEAFARQYVAERAAEIEASKDQPFVLLGANELEEQAVSPSGTPAGVAVPDAETASAARMMAATARHAPPERESPVQKISRLNVGERVMLALKGNKDERFLLIRDGARIVSNAVLDSPKLTEAEADMFASLKNVHESILRALGTRKKFLKRYPVIRALTMNPKTPLDISLALLPHLLTNDLKNLTKNRDVADTVIKGAVRLYRERTSAKKE